MIDYYDKIVNLNDEKLSEEIERITRRLFKVSPQSPTYNQLLNMLEIAESMYMEKLMIESAKNNKDEVINIGEIESVEYTPDYTEEDLVIITARAYLNKGQGNKK
jgi:hypothetical protein